MTDYNKGCIYMIKHNQDSIMKMFILARVVILHDENAVIKHVVIILMIKVII